ncbi:MAG: hypothetical protein AAFP76_02245 [Bacteroidota bacterium]
MHSNSFHPVRWLLILTIGIFCITPVFSQTKDAPSAFWQKVRFGGGLGLGFGNGFFSGSISPSAIYDFNEYFSLGPSLIFSYQEDDFFKNTLYGGSVIALANPIREIQISAELEQLRVNQEFETFDGTLDDDFWNTALFVGGGYRTGNFTVGVRYNLLFKNDDRVYADAWAPFVRVFF